MPDREKVLKGLECCISEHICRGCPYKINEECEDSGYYYSKAIEDALALLKEQEPVEPKEIVNEHFPVGDYRRTIGWLCGKCGKTLMGDGDYCSYCGKKVKWDA